MIFKCFLTIKGGALPTELRSHLFSFFQRTFHIYKYNKIFWNFQIIFIIFCIFCRQRGIWTPNHIITAGLYNWLCLYLWRNNTWSYLKSRLISEGFATPYSSSGFHLITFFPTWVGRLFQFVYLPFYLFSFTIQI